MKITLSLKATFQSWGSPEPWTARRKTELKPTASAIYGLIGCAMGVQREGDEDKTEWIRSNVTVTIPDPEFSFDESVITTDDQIVKGLTEDMKFTCQGDINEGKNNGMSGLMPQIRKEYIADKEMTVYLEGEKEPMEKVLDYLLHPIYPYYLGRACCIPSKCIVKSVEE